MVEKHSEMHLPRIRITAGHGASGRAFLEIIAIVGDMHAEVALLGHVLETLLRDMHRKVFKRGSNLAQHRRVDVKILERGDQALTHLVLTLLDSKNLRVTQVHEARGHRVQREREKAHRVLSSMLGANSGGSRGSVSSALARTSGSGGGTRTRARARARVRQIVQADDRDVAQTCVLRENMCPLTTFAFLVKGVQVLLSRKQRANHRFGDASYRPINDIGRL